MSGIVVNNDETVSGTIFSNETVKVTICDGIEGIGTYVTMEEFYSASQSSDEVSYGEFVGSKITEIVLPKSLKSIGVMAFYNCQSLTELNIPKGITEIGYRAFYQCPSLEQVTIGSVESIGNNAFNGCTNLEQVTIGDVESIGSDAFYHCTNLNTITIHQPEGSVAGYETKWGAPDTTQIIWDE